MRHTGRRNRKRIEQRREEAAERQARYDGLSLKDKLIQITNRPGNSTREKEKIARHERIKRAKAKKA